MGIAMSQPEPMIGAPGKRTQPALGVGKSNSPVQLPKSHKGWLPEGKVLYLEILSFGVFGELWSLAWVNKFFFNWIVTVTIFWVILYWLPTIAFPYNPQPMFPPPPPPPGSGFLQV